MIVMFVQSNALHEHYNHEALNYNGGGQRTEYVPLSRPDSESDRMRDDHWKRNAQIKKRRIQKIP